MDTTAPDAANRRAGWSAVASGLMGLMSFGCLLAMAGYIASHLPDEFKTLADAPFLLRLLLKGVYVGSMLQALFMIPVAAAAHTLGRLRSPRLSQLATVVGIGALTIVVLLRVLIFVDSEVSDILFIGPMGFVGVWLIVVNWLRRDRISRGLRIAGTVAGVGFVIAGMSFFFLGGLAEVAHPGAYANNVPFHIGLWVGGIPAFILYPIWAILLARSFRSSASIQAIGSV